MMIDSVRQHFRLFTALAVLAGILSAWALMAVWGWDLVTGLLFPRAVAEGYLRQFGMPWWTVPAALIGLAAAWRWSKRNP